MQKSGNFIKIKRTILNVPLLVVAVMLLTTNNAHGAITNCSQEFTQNGTTYCGVCNTGYALTGVYSCYTSGSGIGSRCIFYCDVSNACTASTSTSNGVITTTYTKKSSAPSYCITDEYCNANVTTATSGNMSTSSFCSSQTTKECAAGYYGNGTTCTPCPSPANYNVYNNAALTTTFSATSAAGSTSVTSCYITVYANSQSLYESPGHSYVCGSSPIYFTN